MEEIFVAVGWSEGVEVIILLLSLTGVLNNK